MDLTGIAYGYSSVSGQLTPQLSGAAFGRSQAIGMLLPATGLKQAITYLPMAAVAPLSPQTPSSRLVIAHRIPTHTEEQVPVDALVEFDLIDTGNWPWADALCLRVWVDDVLGFDGGSFVAPYDGSRAAIRKLDLNRTRISLCPRSPFATDTIVHVRIEASFAGKTAANSYWFQTFDDVPPRIVSAIARSPRVVQVRFSEPVGLAGAVWELGRVTLPSYLPRLAEAVQEGPWTALLLFESELSPKRRYSLTVSAVTDRHGNQITAPFDVVTFTAATLPAPANRRFDIWRMLPSLNRREDRSGDLKRFTTCAQELVDLMLYDIDRFADQLDPDLAAESTVDRMLEDAGNPFPTDALDRAAKIRLVKALPTLYALKGTEPGLQYVARFFLGLEVQVDAYLANNLRLGESILGEDWRPGPGPRRDRYSFDVMVHRVLTDTERALLTAIIQYLKPAHEHFRRLLEPSDNTIDHIDLEYSELGDDGTFTPH